MPLTEVVTLPIIKDEIHQLSDNKINITRKPHDLIISNMNHSEGFCYYLGLLILIPYLSKVAEMGKKNLLQWIVSLFLGVKNIEQSKILNFNSLSIIIGETTRNLHAQRKSLKMQVNTQSINELQTFNMELAGVKDCVDFYYDPHTKHYTGLKKILKGWCSKIRFADKVINMDFIHTRDGYPVYIDNTDNFDDLRIRFFKNINSFRCLSQIPDDQELTYIVDRGIFSKETLEQVAGMPNTHLITWEKNYNHSEWKENIPCKKGCLIRYRNNREDIKQINYSYQEKKWEKSDRIRQVIVRIESPKGENKIEVSILTDDLMRDANEIVQLMFSRWIQENDFKYLIEHFGINEITTYSSNNWEEIKNETDDKFYISGQYKALTNEIDNIRGRLKTVLLKKHRYDKKYSLSNKKQNSNQIQSHQKILIQISQLSKLLEEKELQRDHTEKLISKNKELSQQNYQRLNMTVKLYMDIIKIIARNIYYKSFQMFKKLYNNYRDDHLIYRNLISCNGFISFENEMIQIKLCPEMELQPKVKVILDQIIQNINQLNPTIPNGGTKSFNLSLYGSNESFFAIAI